MLARDQIDGEGGRRMEGLECRLQSTVQQLQPPASRGRGMEEYRDRGRERVQKVSGGRGRQDSRWGIDLRRDIGGLSRTVQCAEARGKVCLSVFPFLSMLPAKKESVGLFSFGFLAVPSSMCFWRIIIYTTKNVTSLDAGLEGYK